MNVIDHLDISSNHSVLDLGCGDGSHSRYACQKTSGQIVYLDIDFVNLCGFKKTLSREINLHGMCANALKLPFADESFDRVICSLVLYFLPFQTALTELYRVVKTNGKVYIRLPLLIGDRIVYILGLLIRNPRLCVYHSLLTINGLCYALTGNQFSNPFLRNEQLAFYVPHHIFNQALTKAGFMMEHYIIDRPAPHFAAIDAWVRKI